MKVVVVGAGVLGLGVARALAAMDGVQTTVLESRYPAGGSTGLSAGAFIRQYVDEHELVVRCAGVERLAELEQRHGLNLRRIGVMRAIRDADTWTACERSVEMQRRLGVEDSRVIDAEEISRLVPHLNTDGMLGALWGPSDGYLDGAELCNILVDEIGAAGVGVHVRTTVTGLSRGGAAKYTVHTDHGNFPADVIVNAAGAWLGKVGESFDAPVEMLNERHEAYIFVLPETVGYTFPLVADYVPSMTADEGLYFRHEGTHQLIAGLHSNELAGAELVDPDDFYKGATQDRADVVIDLLARTLPGLDDLGYQGGWAGIYPHAAAGRAIIGPHPDNPDVIVAGGLAGQGLTVGLILGEAAAEWARYGELREWPSLERLKLPATTATEAVDG
jgi:sarcosine oxidase subunit beta